MQERILFLIHQTNNKANGGLNSLAEILLNLKRVTPVVLTQRESALAERLRKGGIKVIVNPGILQTPKSASDFWKWLGFGRRLAKILKDQNIHKVHINDIQSLTYSIWFLKLLGQKIVFNIRDVKEPGKPYRWHWLLVNWVHEIIVLSNGMRKELLARLPLRRKQYWQNHMHAIYSIVDPDRFAARNEKGLIRKDVLYAAAFNYKKNQNTFVRQALPILAAKGIVVNFVGDVQNEYGEACRRLVEQLGLEKYAVFHGYQPKIEEWYNKSRITVVPTRREGLARCMIESLACGTPVVSFDVCSAREILDGYQCGVVVSQGDYSRLSEELINLNQDSKRREFLGANGIRVVNTLFQAKEVVGHYEAIYLS